jgi:hypothetical protein
MNRLFHSFFTFVADSIGPRTLAHPASCVQEEYDRLGGEQELDEAEQIYRKALEMDPTDASTLSNLGHLLHTVHASASTHACALLLFYH